MYILAQQMNQSCNCQQPMLQSNEQNGLPWTIFPRWSSEVDLPLAPEVGAEACAGAFF